MQTCIPQSQIGTTVATLSQLGKACPGLPLPQHLTSLCLEHFLGVLHSQGDLLTVNKLIYKPSFDNLQPPTTYNLRKSPERAPRLYNACLPLSSAI